jgi:hypothetical protein
MINNQIKIIINNANNGFLAPKNIGVQIKLKKR